MTKNRKSSKAGAVLTSQGVRDLNPMGPKRPRPERDPRIAEVAANSRSTSPGRRLPEVLDRDHERWN